MVLYNIYEFRMYIIFYAKFIAWFVFTHNKIIFKISVCGNLKWSEKQPYTKTCMIFFQLHKNVRTEFFVIAHDSFSDTVKYWLQDLIESLIKNMLLW